MEGVDSLIRKGRIMSAIHFVPVCLNSRQQQHEHADVPSVFPFGKNPGANSPSDADVFNGTAGSASARNYRDRERPSKIEDLITFRWFRWASLHRNLL